MSKIVDQPILMVEEKGKPRRFFWFKRWIKVSDIVDVWREVGRWWDGEREKMFFRVVGAEGCVYEIYNDQKRWALYRVLD